MYKKAKKEVKNVVRDTKSKAHDDLYNKQRTKGKRYFLDWKRERKSRDLDHVKRKKNDGQKN